MDEIVKAIKSCRLLDHLLEGEAERLADTGDFRAFKKNTVIIATGDTSDNVYILASGAARVYRTNEEGRQITLNTLQPGTMFGELAALSDAPRAANVAATQAITTAIFPKQDFLDMLHRNPAVTIDFSRNFAQMVQVMADHLADIALLDVYGRLTRLFDRNATERNGKQVVEGFTHQALADNVGTSREVVSRIISALKKGEYISSDPETKGIILEKKLPSGY